MKWIKAEYDPRRDEARDAHGEVSNKMELIDKSWSDIQDLVYEFDKGMYEEIKTLWPLYRQFQTKLDSLAGKLLDYAETPKDANTEDNEMVNWKNKKSGVEEIKVTKESKNDFGVMTLSQDGKDDEGIEVSMKFDGKFRLGVAPENYKEILEMAMNEMEETFIEVLRRFS